jgi:hypothetical protein
MEKIERRDFESREAVENAIADARGFSSRGEMRSYYETHGYPGSRVEARDFPVYRPVETRIADASNDIEDFEMRLIAAELGGK